MPVATHIEDDQRRGSVFPLKSVGAWLCLLVALYFLASALFAIANFDRYGAALPQFLRYIAIPAAIAAAFIVIPFALGRDKVLLVGIYSACILTALFLVEAVLTLRTIPVLFGSLGQLDEEQRQEIEERQP